MSGAGQDPRELTEASSLGALHPEQTRAFDDPGAAGRQLRRGRVMSRVRRLLAAVLLAAPLGAQVPADLQRERDDFARWLRADPTSPYAALGLHPVGNVMSIGAEPADIPIPGVARGIITEERGVVVLATAGAAGTRRVLPRERVVPLGAEYRLIVSGPPGRAVVVAFGAVRRPKQPVYYGHEAGLRLSAALEPPERRGRFRTLGLDGAETDATEAGFVTLTLPTARPRLRVYRVGAADDEEAPLLIFFRDSTNARGTYPAGRFVELIPEGGGRYLVDFNRARNPYCAYSSIFPCPAPWPGNAVAAAIPAGERYPATAP